MLKNIGELKKMLLKAGFNYRQGKGSHTFWTHPHSLPFKNDIEIRSHLDYHQQNQRKFVNLFDH